MMDLDRSRRVPAGHSQTRSSCLPARRCRDRVTVRYFECYSVVRDWCRSLFGPTPSTNRSLTLPVNFYGYSRSVFSRSISAPEIDVAFRDANRCADVAFRIIAAAERFAHVELCGLIVGARAF